MTEDQGHQPVFESDQHAEWRIRDGDVLVLRYDRQTGAWAGERERLNDAETGGLRGPETLSPHEAQIIARGRDLRFRDGSKPA